MCVPCNLACAGEAGTPERRQGQQGSGDGAGVSGGAGGGGPPGPGLPHQQLLGLAQGKLASSPSGPASFSTSSRVQDDTTRVLVSRNHRIEYRETLHEFSYRETIVSRDYTEFSHRETIVSRDTTRVLMMTVEEEVSFLFFSVELSDCDMNNGSPCDSWSD